MSDKQIIKSGTNSTNIQGKEVSVHQHNGINYTDAKEIALDVFEKNFYKLSGEAADTAKQRMEEFSEQLMVRMKSESELLLNSLKNPDMQYDLFTAQKAYARTGDTNLSEMLVNLLIERSKENERTTYQLVLNESITVLDKLTSEQLDILSLSFILMRTRESFLLNEEDVLEYFKSNITRFTNEISGNQTNFKHLVYAGCSSITTGGYMLELSLLNRYPGMFSHGFTLEKFQEITTDAKDLKLIVPHLVKDDHYQIIANHQGYLERLFDRYQTEPSIRSRIIELQNGLKMSENEVRPFLIKLIPEISGLFDLWDNTSLSDLNLTSVGTCLAIINLNSKGFKGYNLSNWID